jgi:putative endonuclease
MKLSDIRTESDTDEKACYLISLHHSVTNPEQRYIGITTDLDARLNAHNEVKSTHTSKYRSWELINYIAFKERSMAFEFE